MLNKHGIRLLSLIVFIFLFALSAAALEQPVKAELLTSAKTVAPGETFYVGVKLTMNDPWHVYWKYPGESGLPTKINYKTSPEISLYPAKFPTPIRFMQPGEIEGFGYEREVVLISEAIVSEKLEVGKAVPINAEVSWLACSPEICFPGKAKLNGTVKLDHVTTPETKGGIVNWIKQIPEPIENCTDALDWSIDRKDLSKDEASVLITLNWKEKSQVDDWILALSSEYDVSAVEIKNTKAQSSIGFKIKRIEGMTVSEPVLESVAVIKQADGSTKGILIPVSTGL